MFVRLAASTLFATALFAAASARAADPAPDASASGNRLSPEEAAAGWTLLFDGASVADWRTNEGEPLAGGVEDGCLAPHKAGGYMVVPPGEWGDFVLRFDVKMARPYCNSGVFFRVHDLGDPPRHGLEFQVASIGLKAEERFGAIYDLVAPEKFLDKEEMFDWHSVELTAKGPLVEAKVDGEVVLRMNCDDFDKPNERPDGSKHKFGFAIRDMPRRGRIGFQDHGTKVWYRNIRILSLDATE